MVFARWWQGQRRDAGRHTGRPIAASPRAGNLRIGSRPFASPARSGGCCQGALSDALYTEII